MFTCCLRDIPGLSQLHPMFALWQVSHVAWPRSGKRPQTRPAKPCNPSKVWMLQSPLKIDITKTTQIISFIPSKVGDNLQVQSICGSQPATNCEAVQYRHGKRGVSGPVYFLPLQNHAPGFNVALHNFSNIVLPLNLKLRWLCISAPVCACQKCHRA